MSGALVYFTSNVHPEPQLDQLRIGSFVDQMEGMGRAVWQCNEVAVHSLILNQRITGSQVGIHLHPIGGFVSKHPEPLRKAMHLRAGVF